MTRALPLFALLSLTAAVACTRADAAPKTAPKVFIAAAEAPTYLIAGGKGTAQLFVNQTTGANDVAVSIVTFSPGALVPKHAHEAASETLYIERGAIEMDVGGKKLVARAGDALYLPAGVEHEGRVLGSVDTLRAVQVYVGPGPEQRFAKGERVTAP